MLITYVGRDVTGMNRPALEGEEAINVSTQELVWGMDTAFYYMDGSTFVAVDSTTADQIYVIRRKETNAALARQVQDEMVMTLHMNELRKGQELPPIMTEEQEVEFQNTIQLLQGQVDHPPDDDIYEPPLPPSVTPPDYESITITVTRVPGWNDVLGYRFVIDSMDPEFTPGVLSPAVYQNPNCDGYLYTTGAFQWDSEAQEWYAICPAGQEPGDEDINFGLLYSGTPTKCFTLKQGVQKQTFNVYQ